MPQDPPMLLCDEGYNQLAGVPKRGNDVLLGAAGVLRGTKGGNRYGLDGRRVRGDFRSDFGHVHAFAWTWNVRCDSKARGRRWDNGTEFHGYREIEAATGVRCYFAYPHHPWERGSNENFNGLLRQYFRKGKPLTRARQSDCDQATAKLNQRPRKRYGFQTPTQRLQQLSGVLHFAC